MNLYNYFSEKLLLPIGDLVFRTGFSHRLQELRQTVLFSEIELQNLQKKKLNALLSFASKNSRYYQSLKLTGNTDPVLWLKQFPVLDKHILKRNCDNLLTSVKSSLICHKSSGSSGIQSTVYWSKKEQDIHRANQILWWEWAGYRIGDPILQTGITPKRGLVKSLKDLMLRTQYINAFSIKPNDAVLFLKHNSSDKSRVIAGYASSLYVLSKIAAEHNLNVKFKTAIVWGDKLFAHYRDSIAKSFQCDVYETYASAEGLMMAAQYDLPYMYLMTPSVYVELLDDNDNEVPDGEMGHVVVTNLNGFAMPLIRYRIGDLAVKLPRNQYPAKRMLNLPLLKQVVGRDTDLVKTRNGSYMVVHSFTGIFEHIPSIKQFRVVQDHLDGITIEYIQDPEFHHDILEVIKQKIRHELGESFDVNFKQVAVIPDSPSGKPQIIVSGI